VSGVDILGYEDNYLEGILPDGWLGVAVGMTAGAALTWLLTRGAAYRTEMVHGQEIRASYVRGYERGVEEYIDFHRDNPEPRRRRRR
jgi:hypothetical protein